MNTSRPDNPLQLAAVPGVDHEAFRRAVHAAPHDDAPKLVYADYLDEQGHNHLANTIRAIVQNKAKVLPAQHHISSIVTVPRGTWKWQDAFAISIYRPTKGVNGAWYYRAHRYPVAKASLPQLRRFGYTPDNITMGGRHNHPVPDHIAHELELGHQVFGPTPGSI